MMLGERDEFLLLGTQHKKNRLLLRAHTRAERARWKGGQERGQPERFVCFFFGRLLCLILSCLKCDYSIRFVFFFWLGPVTQATTTYTFVGICQLSDSRLHGERGRAVCEMGFSPSARLFWMGNAIMHSRFVNAGTSHHHHLQPAPLL